METNIVTGSNAEVTLNGSGNDADILQALRSDLPGRGELMPFVIITMKDSFTAEDNAKRDAFQYTLVQLMGNSFILERLICATSQTMDFNSVVSSRILESLMTHGGMRGDVSVYLYMISPFSGVPGLTGMMTGLSNSFRVRLGISIDKTERFSSEAHRRLRGHYDMLLKTAYEATKLRHKARGAATGAYTMRQIGDGQSNLWADSAKRLARYASHARCDWLHDTIRRYYEADLKPVELEASTFIPVTVRSPEDDGLHVDNKIFSKAPPPDRRPVTITSLGMDEFVKRGIPVAQNTGWVTKDMAKLLEKGSLEAIEFVDGDELIAWPTAHQFWLKTDEHPEGNYSPYSGRIDFISKVFEQLLLKMGDRAVLINIGVDFDLVPGFGVEPMKIKGLVVKDDAILRRNMASRGSSSDQPTNVEATIRDQLRYIEKATRLGIPMLSDFDQIREPGIYIATSGAGKTHFIRERKTKVGLEYFFPATSEHPRTRVIFASEEDELNAGAHISWAPPFNSMIKNEHKRFLISTISGYVTALTTSLLEHAEQLKPEERETYLFNHGLDYLILITTSAALEFNAMNGGTRARSKTNLTRLLTNYSSGLSSDVPDVVLKLRSEGRKISFISKKDFGLTDTIDDTSFSSDAQQAISTLASFDGKDVSKIDSKPKAPYTEHLSSQGPPRVTASGLTCSLQPRNAIMLSTMLQSSNACHLLCGQQISPFISFYRGVLDVMLEFPGSGGKAIKKVMTPVLQLLMTNVNIECPKTVGMGVFEMPTEMVHVDDPNTRAVLCEVLELDLSSDIELIRRHCVEAVSKLHPLMGSAVDIISRFAIGGTITYADPQLLQVYTHLTRADVVGGYVSTLDSTMSVYGYTSHVRKMEKEGVNCEVEPACKDVLMDKWSSVFAGLSTIDTSREAIIRRMRELSKGTSAGADKVQFKDVTREIALGNKGQSDKSNSFSISTNTKSILLMLVGSHYLPPVGTQGRTDFATILRSSQIGGFGSRNAISRARRPVYNISPSSLSIQKPLEEATKAYMLSQNKLRNHPLFSIVAATGSFVPDNQFPINSSILAAQGKVTCFAADATAFDQHVGPGFREVMRQALSPYSQATAKDDFSQDFGLTYAAAVDQLVVNREGMWFALRSSGSPTTALYVRTQASGELTTGSENSVNSASIMDWLVSRLPELIDPAKFKLVCWGDDVFFTTGRKYTPQEYICILKSIEEGGKQCGQVYGYKDAYQGSVAHYLQQFLFGGQQYGRSRALDHERSPETGPESIGSHMTKISEICEQGGNSSTFKVWSVATFALTSSISAFGRTVTLPPLAFLSPGGLLNQLMILGAPPTSQLYLTLIAEQLGLVGEVPKVTVTVDKIKVGRRIIDSSGPVQATLAGDTFKVDDLDKATEDTFYAYSAKDRVASFERTPEAMRKQLDTAAFSSWPKNQASLSLGVYMSQSHMKRWFQEQVISNIMGGEFPKDKVKMEEIPLPMKRIPTVTEFRIGDTRMSFSLNSGYTIGVKRKAVGQTMDCFEFLMVDVDGVTILKYDLRWHPFFRYSEPQRLVLSLFGVADGKQASRVFGSAKNILRKFSADAFRPDLTPELVIRILQATEEVDRRMALQGMGFMDAEIDRVMTAYQGAHLFEEIVALDDMSSAPVYLQSSSTDRALNLLRLQGVVTVNGASVEDAFDNLTSSDSTHTLRDTLLSIFGSFITTEALVHCYEQHVLSNLGVGDVFLVARIPRFNILTSS